MAIDGDVYPQNQCGGRSYMTDGVTVGCARASVGGASQPGRWPALILVDFARAYFDPQCGLYAAVEAERAVAARMAETMRACRFAVVFTRVSNARPADGGHFYRKVPALEAFDAGNPMAEFAAELTPREAILSSPNTIPVLFS